MYSKTTIWSKAEHQELACLPSLWNEKARVAVGTTIITSIVGSWLVELFFLFALFSVVSVLLSSLG
eukprot:6463937-Amphidinium_carterae.1